jgi:beta-1,4-mannooligosaccharide phosphorylase
MWYSYRSNEKITTYRIGYAESQNAINWVRKDESVGIDVSENDWDSEMICYPSVFTLNSKTYMLYNGNDYGKTGFGIAILK